MAHSRRFFLYLTAELVSIVNVTCVDIVVCVAAAAAIEFSPALFAFGL